MENPHFEYSPLIRRPRFHLPNGARVAVWVAVNVEHFDIESTSFGPGPGAKHPPDIRNYSMRDYGTRVGIWRVMEVLDKHKIRGTASLNSDVCDRYPVIIEEAKKRGWEFMGHGVNNTTLLAGLSEAEERRVIATSLEAVARAVGERPKGWRSPGMAETFNTPNILADEGIRYLSDWYNDDQPYTIKVKNGRLIGLPASAATSDMQAFIGHNLMPEQFCQIMMNQFDVLYKEGADQGRIMSISLHPFVIGLPFRIKCLDDALKYVTSHDNVWLATGWDIASWYYENYYK
jgi:allantoinase